MHRTFLLLFFFLILGCSSPPEPIPVLPYTKESTGNPIVAFYRGSPIRWKEVTEKLLDLGGRNSIDQYLRWRVLDDARKSAPFTTPPEELRLRAKQALEEEIRVQGKSVVRKQLRDSGMAEDDYIRRLAESSLLKNTLLQEKIVRFTALQRGWSSYEEWTFSSRKSADDYLSGAGAAESTPRKRILYRESTPSGLSKDSMDLLFSTPAGKYTPVIPGKNGTYRVMKIQSSGQARKVSWPEVEKEVFTWILQDPPTQGEFLFWLEDQLKRSKIEYANRSPERN